ncbi:MAG: hypothetical protein ACSHYB_14540 [Roseibacillus sp.]
MAGQYDPLLKQIFYGCVGLAGIGALFAAMGANIGFVFMILSMAIATPVLFHFAMQWPLKDGDKKKESEEEK